MKAPNATGEEFDEQIRKFVKETIVRRLEDFVNKASELDASTIVSKYSQYLQLLDKSEQIVGRLLENAKSELHSKVASILKKKLEHATLKEIVGLIKTSSVIKIIVPILMSSENKLIEQV